MSDIKKCLSKSQTYEPLQNAILKILKDYRDHNPISPALFATTFGLRAAITDQDQIGWDNFLLGRWSKKWQTVQQRHITQTKSRRSSLQWTTCIINKFLRTVWDIWNFRNALVHGKGGVFQRATNSELDFQIREEFTIGFENFRDEDKKLYRDYTVPILTNNTITFKR